MTDFDKKLRMKLQSYKEETGVSFFKIADKAGINRQTLYSFSAGMTALNGENTGRLMDYLNLTIHLEEK